MNVSGRYRILKRLEMVERLACLELVDWEFPSPFLFSELPQEIQSDLLSGTLEKERGSIIASIDYSMTPFPMTYLVEKMGQNETFIRKRLFEPCLLNNDKNHLVRARALRMLANLVVHFEIYRFVRGGGETAETATAKTIGQEIGKRRRRLVDSARLLFIEIRQYASYVEKLIEGVRIYAAPEMYLRDDRELDAGQAIDPDENVEYSAALNASETMLAEIEDFKTNYLTPLEQLENEMLQAWKLEDLPPLLVRGIPQEQLRLRFIKIMARLFDRFHLWVDPQGMFEARDNFINGVFEIIESKSFSEKALAVLIKQAELPGRRNSPIPAK